MKTRKQKEEIVEKLEGAFKKGVSSVFVHFSGLSVADETAVRRTLRADKVSYFVAKKTLIRRALEKLGHPSKDVALSGEVAVAWGGGDDATLPARLIHEFGTKFKDKLTILGGLFEGRLIGEVEMKSIATIPPLDTLRGMFANVVNSPIQRFAIALGEVVKTKTQ